MVGKILSSIFGGIFVIALGLIIAYLAIPGFKKTVDDAFSKEEIKQEETTDEVTEGTEEDVEVPENVKLVPFMDNFIKAFDLTLDKLR